MMDYMYIHSGCKSKMTKLFCKFNYLFISERKYEYKIVKIVITIRYKYVQYKHELYRKGSPWVWKTYKFIHILKYY
jgi:hypothetical protein